MKLSVSAWCVQDLLFQKKLSIFEFIDFCCECNVDAVELLDCFMASEEQVDKVRTYLGKINMPVSAYSIGNDFVQKKSEDRYKQIAYVKNGIDTAVFLETSNLRVFSGHLKEDIPYEEGMRWIVDCFRECVSYAEGKGIVLVLENHGLFAGKSKQVIELLESVNSPMLKANADTGNFLLVGEAPLEAVRNLKDNIGFVHFKDLKKVGIDEVGYEGCDGSKYQGTIIGQGDVPMNEIVALLRKCNYKGYLSLEYEGIGDSISGTRESIIYMKSILQGS